MRTILEILQSVAAQLKLKPPTTINNTRDANAMHLVAIAHYVGKKIRDAHEWPELRKTWSIRGVADTTSYALPDDLLIICSGSEWLGKYTSGALSERLGGPSNSSQWQALKAKLMVAPSFSYRIMTGAPVLLSPGKFSYPKYLQLSEAPTTEDTFNFEFLSRTWIRPRHYTALDYLYQAGEIIVNNAGQHYATSLTGYGGAPEPTHSSGSVSGSLQSYRYEGRTYDKFLRDTDRPLFDCALVELAIMARWKRLNGQDASEAEAEYREYLDAAKANATGAAEFNMFNVQPYVDSAEIDWSQLV